tara:strand:+ start:1060 stop:1242 length:183 start_codon:yes stop_codon:yes gene_type:complete
MRDRGQALAQQGNPYQADNPYKKEYLEDNYGIQKKKRRTSFNGDVSQEWSTQTCDSKEIA